MIKIHKSPKDQNFFLINKKSGKKLGKIRGKKSQKKLEKNHKRLGKKNQTETISKEYCKKMSHF